MERRDSDVQILAICSGESRKNLNKVKDLQADVIIYDLEDAVPVNEKVIARQKVKEAICKISQQVNFVRVNDLTTPYFIEDLDGIIAENLSGIVLPKVNNQHDIIIAAYLLGQMEEKYGLEEGSLAIVPLIETASGIQNVQEIVCASNRILCLCFGAEDFMLDLHIDAGEMGENLMYARTQLVIASKAAGKEPPVDSVFVDFKDEAGLEKETERAKCAGFQGKLLIHPKQIAPVHHAFSPTREQVKEAEKIIALYGESLKNGKGALEIDGKMIDAPVVERARKVLSHADM